MRGDDDELPIRPAVLDDAQALADLSTELGYPAPVAAIALRLRELLAASDQVVYVATDRALVIGWIHAARQLLLDAGTRCESHPFYERLGYERTKTQHVYRKRLGDAPAAHDS